jgi:hypothetical protein
MKVSSHIHRLAILRKAGATVGQVRYGGSKGPGLRRDNKSGRRREYDPLCGPEDYNESGCVCCRFAADAAERNNSHNL